MSEGPSTIEERFLLLLAKLDAQTSSTEKLSRTLEQVKAEAAESQRALEEKVEQQGEKIQQLEGEVRGPKETSSSPGSIIAARPSEDVQTGKLVRRWRLVFVVGALMPHGLVLGSLIDGDMRLVAASTMFETFG